MVNYKTLDGTLVVSTHKMVRYLITNLQLLPWLSHHQGKIHQNVHSSQRVSYWWWEHMLHAGICCHPSHSDVIGNKYFPWKDLGERTSKPSISPSCSPEVLPEHAFQPVESFFRLLEYLAFLLGLEFLSAFRWSKPNPIRRQEQYQMFSDQYIQGPRIREYKSLEKGHY